MAETLLVRRIHGCDAARFPRIGAALLERVEAPTLVIAELAGDALLLGRHQRAASAIHRGPRGAAGLAVHRRLGGGRAVRAGAGRIGVLLALPRAGLLLPAPVGADKVINRYVRGLLAGLTHAAGSGVHYFGRDFLSVEGKQIGVVSQDGLADGRVIFEAIVGVERSLELPAGASAYPAHEDPRAGGPPWDVLATFSREPHPFDDLAERIAAGYARAYGCAVDFLLDDAPLAEAAIEPPVDEDEAGWEESGLADVAIGFAEALVRHDGSAVREARLRGDFIAPAFVLRQLEASLAGCPLAFQAIGTRVDAAFRQPGAAILGLRSLRVLADAVLAAAGRLG